MILSDRCSDKKVVKNRNDQDFRNGITKWATGGIKNRGGIDNVLTTTSLLELNKHLNINLSSEGTADLQEKGV